MAIHVALHHQTVYRYDRRISLGPQIIKLRPAPHCRTPILSYSLRVLPKKHFINWQQDPQGNYLARLVFPEPATELFVEVDLVAEMAVFNPFDFFLEPHAEQYPFSYESSAARELRPFLETEPAGPGLSALLAKVPRGTQRTIDFLVGLNQIVRNEVGYVIRMEPGVQTCEKTLTLRTGSCRDSAWLLVQTMRHVGLAARFVSGYLIQLVADVKPLEGPSVRPHSGCTRGPKPSPGAGWGGSIPRPACSRARGISRSLALRTPAARRPYPVCSTPATRNSGTR
jgi:transglutaminase-like putative cysteine protease